MFITDEETIVAQCTPRGSGAVALLRMSGPDAINVAEKFSKLASKQALSKQKTHTIHYGWVVDDNKKHIDQVLFLLMKAPKTFTGQNTVEITCHNNPFIIEKIIQQAIAAGARPAGPGEFTKRAFLNKKIDLTQAEAINELIHANTQTTLKQALCQVEGSLLNWVTSLEEELLKALSLCEVRFEFIDEEDMEFDGQIQERLTSVEQTIEKLKKTFDQQQHIRQGIRIAIIGKVNAGKSSLLNALLSKNRAIVTQTPGTTRDIIEAGVYRNGNYWTFVDTAGLRKTSDAIEKEGIERSQKETKNADVILLVFDGSEKMTPEDVATYKQIIDEQSSKVILIQNKTDLKQSLNIPLKSKPILKRSTKNKAGIEAIERAVEKKVAKLLGSLELPFLINQRQFNLLLKLEQEVKKIKQMLTKKTGHELLSLHLRLALESLTELSGRTIEKKNLDLIFENFCVGK